MKYILSLDQGTTSSRAILFDRRGRAVSSAQKEFRQIFPKPGWVEHDPDEIWRSQASVAKEAVSAAGVDPSEIGALGLGNQRETVVMWNRKTGRPVSHAIVWQDRRTAKACDRLVARGWEEPIRKTTGLVVDPYLSATKIQWMLRNVEGARAMARRGALAVGTVDSWLIWNLTGGKRFVTDASNASRTMLYDIRKGRWSQEMLSLFGVPETILPEVVPSSGACGECALFSHAIPVAGIAGDQQAALFGQACTGPGLAKNTYGTGCFLLAHTGTRPVDSKNHLLTTVAWKIGKTTEYALEGSVFIAGAVVQWLRDGLGLIKAAPEIEALAGRVKDSGGVYFVPAFSGLGAPHWDPYARGCLVGLTRGTTSAHVARAALEGIAFQVLEVLRAMRSDTGLRLSELRVDGGACSNNLLMQIQSDLAGIAISRPKVQETTALGAAYLAGLAVGFWKNREAIAKQWRIDKQFTPALGAAARNKMIRGWQRAVERAKAWEGS